MWHDKGGAGTVGKGHRWVLCPCSPDDVSSSQHPTHELKMVTPLLCIAKQNHWEIGWCAQGGELRMEFISWTTNSGFIVLPHSGATGCVWFRVVCRVPVTHTHHTHVCVHLPTWASENLLPRGSPLLPFLWLCTWTVLSAWESRWTLMLLIFSGLENAKGSLLFYSHVRFMTTSADVCTNN